MRHARKPRRSARAVARIVVAVAVEAGAVLSLTTIGRRAELRVPLGHLGPWLRHRDAATVAVATLRGVGLVVAGWLLVSTVLYLAASASRAPAFVRAVGWTTLPAVRRAVDATVAVSIVTSVVVGPATAGSARPNDPPVVSLVRDGHGGAIAGLPADTAVPSTPAPSTTVTTLAAPPAPVGTSPPEPEIAAPREVVVRAGDNLWMLAAAHLAASTGRSPADVTDAEIAPYWVRVCDANRERLRSRDPDLVYPGERVALPPVA